MTTGTKYASTKGSEIFIITRNEFNEDFLYYKVLGSSDSPRKVSVVNFETAIHEGDLIIVEDVRKTASYQAKLSRALCIIEDMPGVETVNDDNIAGTVDVIVHGTYNASKIKRMLIDGYSDVLTFDQHTKMVNDEWHLMFCFAF